jgi:hypothetical protein
MTAHTCTTLAPVGGCYRCDLNRDEIAYAEQEAAEQAAREEACPGHNWREIESRLGRYAECIRCGAEEDR